ncbi:MAG: T9SS type A sorting domain-containing protein [Crocinitomix sp.]|nr:T9SS type A sorting domain-containing protein [Crocinitomix sp.]
MPSLSFYPNPTTGVIIVTLPEVEGLITVNVITADGKMGQSYTYSNSHKIELNINGASGMYFVNVIIQTEQYVLKVNKE